MKHELNTLKSRIQNLLSAPDYHPMRVSEVVSILKIPPAERGQVRRAIDRLIQEGIIVRVRKDRLVLPSTADLVTGRIQMHEKGFGFVIPEAPSPSNPPVSDIFISAEDTWVAMHGDRVVVRLNVSPRRKDRSRSDQTEKPYGRVIRILERANPTIIGTLKRSQHFYHIVPDDPRIGRDIYVDIRGSGLKPKPDDRVVVKMSPWENRHVSPEGKLIEIIGPANDPSLDLIVIVKKFRFRVEFPDDVLSELETISDEVPGAEAEGRLDLRNEVVLTIDPDDARDYDDALSLKPMANGHWSLGVHIADVSHYVKPGSSLDAEARERGNSVYLPDRVIPMLPQKLSNGICSLKEGVDRLTQSVIFDIDSQGNIHSYEFSPSIIRSSGRLTYKQALSVIDPKRGLPVAVQSEKNCELLKNLWALASKVRALRFANGSLDLDFPELKIYCDEKGLAERIEKSENDISHQLVEEFMLLANEAVAAELRRQSIPSIYRIHEDPDSEKLEEYRDFVLANGYQMGDPTQRKEIQKLLKRLSGKPEEYLLKLHLLKSLKRAQYSTIPMGHYGLAKENYTHFTSPIRRYADLIIHRTLMRALKKRKRAAPMKLNESGSYDVATLESICGHCSITERVADEAEKESVRLKLIEFFERKMKQHELDSYEAMITEVRNFGMFVELPEFMLSGMVHVSTIGDDFYHFDPSKQRLVGKRTKRMFKPGDKVRVEVARVDRFKKQIDFKITEE
jgi:ribonuclease R